MEGGAFFWFRAGHTISGANAPRERGRVGLLPSLSGPRAADPGIGSGAKCQKILENAFLHLFWRGFSLGPLLHPGQVGGPLGGPPPHQATTRLKNKPLQMLPLPVLMCARACVLRCLSSWVFEHRLDNRLDRHF